MTKRLIMLSFAVALFTPSTNQALAQTSVTGGAGRALSPPVAALGGAGGSLGRAWVSGQGVDAAGCGPIANPCRTIQYAFDNAAAPGGAIYVRDPSGYGAQLSITHAISIINDGSGAAIIGGAASDAIAIQAGANDTVLLKGLTIHGARVSTNGIHLISGGNLVVADCTITGAAYGGSSRTGNGMTIDPVSGMTKVSVSDTLIANNYWVGFMSYPQGGTVNGSLTRVVVTNNGAGGVTSALPQAGVGASNILATQVTSTYNNYGGFEAFYGAILSVGESAAHSNGSGDAYNNSGTINSFGNNAFLGSGIGLTPAPLR